MLSSTLMKLEKKSWNPWQADTKPAPTRTETHSPAWWRTADMTLLKSYTHNKQIFHPCFSYSTEHQEGRTRKGRKDHHPHILHVGANNSYYLHFSHSSLPLFRQNLSFALTSCFFIRSSTTHLQAHQIHGREPRQLLPLFAPRSPLWCARSRCLDIVWLNEMKKYLHKNKNCERLREGGGCPWASRVAFPIATLHFSFSPRFRLI